MLKWLQHSSIILSVFRSKSYSVSDFFAKRRLRGLGGASRSITLEGALGSEFCLRFGLPLSFWSRLRIFFLAFLVGGGESSSLRVLLAGFLVSELDLFLSERLDLLAASVFSPRRALLGDASNRLRARNQQGYPYFWRTIKSGILRLRLHEPISLHRFLQKNGLWRHRSQA